MRTLIWIIAIFAVAAGVAMLAEANQGYLLVVFPPWRAQVSLNLAIVVLVVGFLALHMLVRMVARAIDLPGKVGLFRSRRRQDKAYRSLRDALQALFEGRYTEALRQAKIAWAAGGEAPVAALIAARAAHGLGDAKRYREWMDRLEADRSTRAAGLLTDVELALGSGKLEEASRAMAELKQSEHKSSAAYRLELELARERGDWETAVTALHRLLDNRAIDQAQAREGLRQAHAAQLRALVGEPDKQLAYWRALPREVINDIGMMREVVTALGATGQGVAARRSVERVLDAEWNSELARLYARCAGSGDEAKDALSQAERWLVAHPEDAGLLYALGCQCMQAQIWGKAQSYLEQSLRIDPRKDVQLALGELMERLERPAEAMEYYRAAAQSRALTVVG